MKHQPARAAPVTATAGQFAAYLTGLFLLLAGLVISAPATATPNENDSRTIQYLVDYVRDSDVTFVRNLSKHTSAEAARHIMDKYRHFRDRIETPEQFIELCASESLVTGLDYTIIDPQGREFPTRDWLMDALADYRNRQNQAAK